MSTVMPEDLKDSQQARIRLRPGAEVLRISSDRLQVALPNHNATFTGANAVRPLERILDRIEAGEGEAVQTIVSQVSSETGNSEDFVRYLLRILEQHGCTYYDDRQPPGETAPAADSPTPALDSHLAQSGMKPAAARARLADFPVTLLVPDRLAEIAQQQLQTAGLQAARLMPLRQGQDVEQAQETLDARLASEPPALVTCFGLSYRSSLARLINESCIEHKVPVMFGVIDGLLGRIGPYVAPGDTACLECALERVLSNSSSEDVNALLAHRVRTNGKIGFPPEPHPLFENAILAMFLLETSQIALGRFSRALGGIIEQASVAGISTHNSLLRTPRCPVCSPTKPQRMAWDARFSAPKVKAVDA
jgi:bacteriocin biosynthesis cyclodehydratase domain-containing protein